MTDISDTVPRNMNKICYNDQRPFGWNEFDGDGQRYLKKFTSLVDCKYSIAFVATSRALTISPVL